MLFYYLRVPRKVDAQGTREYAVGIKGARKFPFLGEGGGGGICDVVNCPEVDRESQHNRFDVHLGLACRRVRVEKYVRGQASGWRAGFN